jgi:uncharacterized protein (DUF1778 family)
MPKTSNANTPPPKPARQLGRVSDEDWSLLKSAANAQRMTFTGWALGILIPMAQKTMEKMQ